MFFRIFPLIVFVGLPFLTPAPADADTFGTGANSFEIEFVKIGAPGNPPYSIQNPAGAVPYRYRIAKYEVSERMIDVANIEGSLGITKDTRGPDKPATSITWFEAAQFVNWLNTSTGHTPAYKFDEVGEFQLWEPDEPGYDPGNLYRNRQAFYFLPSIDEWHKAAYYDADTGVWYDYPTGTSDVPDGIDFPGDTVYDAVFFDGGSNMTPNDVMDVGVLSPLGTAGQGGNVDEWEESEFDRQNNSPTADRAFRGGHWQSTSNRLIAINRGDALPSFESHFIGFRIASIPEPSSAHLLGLGIAVLQFAVSRKK